MPDVFEPQVSALLPERDSEVGMVLGRAFVNDPPLKVVLSDVNDPAERARILSRVFRLELTFQRRHGEPIYGIIREGKVVAAVVTEFAHSISTRTVRLTDCGMLPRLVAAIGWRSTLRALKLAKELSQNRPTEPHLYLRLIGVDPLYQGCHYGMALLGDLHALASLRTDLLGIYLETATERNVAYFEHAGYQVLGEMKPLGVRMWRMTHPLGQAASKGAFPKSLA